LSEEVLCTTLEVYEDREVGRGRTIPLRVAVMPARSRVKAEDPVFVLSGGPGQAATEMAALADLIFDDVRRQRDVVLVDLRGTGGSNPLNCPGDEAARLDHEAAAAGDCLRSLGSRADTRFYTTELAMDDVDDVRRALGYERVNLWGGSYGTRMALVYLGRHGEHVRSMILDGIAPRSNKVTLHYARDAQRALDVLIEDCAADPDCSATFPRLREVLEALLADLEAHPKDLRIVHPRTGEASDLRVDKAYFAGQLRNVLYTRQHQSLVPYLVHQAADGDFQPFAAAAAELYSSVLERMDLGMTFSVLCSGDVDRVTDEEARDLGRGAFLGSLAFDSWRAICDVWPHAAPPADSETIRSGVPALLLSGRLDPVTPPPWGESLTERLDASAHVVVPGGAHIVSHEGCLPELIGHFVERASAAGLETSCVEKITRPPFVVAAYGTSP
jgi:pimeloyl-ACP methyl ester carboxylesterase